MRFFKLILGSLIFMVGCASQPVITESGPIVVSRPPAVPVPGNNVINVLPTATPQPVTGRATLALVGDITLARGIADNIKKFGTDWPVALVAQQMRSADLTVANLECPVGESRIPYLEKSVLFRAEPESLSMLQFAGIDLVSLGNNHILDFGPELAGRTEAELAARGIAYAGVVRQEHVAPRTDLEVNGLKIAFLSYCSVCPRQFAIKGSAPGVVPALERIMKRDVRKAAAESDLVMVALHWGQEYFGANKLQRKLAGAVSEAGADIIVGHHTHVVQKVEEIGSSLVFYGLGNFVFDLTHPIAQDSVIIMVEIEKNKKPTWRALPVDLTQGRPRLLDESEEAYTRIQYILKNGYEYGGRKSYPEHGPWEE